MKNILVLDDNQDVLEAVSMRLNKYLKGVNILTASDGSEGKAILRSKPIDMVVTDLSMPVINGYMLIEHAKKHYPAVPVCVMTANYSPEIIGKLQSLGVGRWIQKPFKFDQLARMIAEELNLTFSD